MPENRPTDTGDTPGRDESVDVTDPKELRALAHPVRLSILEDLVVHGPSTATQVAGRIGESPANCSWHLRQLARYGYVEEAGGGTGRQRPWRVVIRQRRFGHGEESPELARASDTLSDVLSGHEFEAMRAWHATRRSEPPHWRDAAFITQSLGWLTAEELRDLGEEVIALYTRYLDRVDDPARRPPGARLVRLIAWGVPATPYDPASDPHATGASDAGHPGADDPGTGNPDHPDRHGA